MAARLPRSVIPLALLLALALIVLLAVQFGVRKAVDLDAGGPLLRAHPASIQGMEVDAPDRTIVLRRISGGWQLEGTVTDLPDSHQVTVLLDMLREETVTPVLMGTSGIPARERYGIGGSESLALRIDAGEGEPVSLVTGRLNPLNDRIYAAGAGRSGVFTVSSALVEALQQLPEWIRLRRLWPVFAQATTETFTLAQSALPTPDLFVKTADGQWWLRQPGDGTLRLGRVALAYDSIYGDRRRQSGGVDFWRASDRKLANLLFRLHETGVKEFELDNAPADSLRAAGLSPPLVVVSLAGPGVPALTAAFGHEVAKGRMLALRNGQPNLLEVTADARGDLLSPLAQFLETGVLSFSVAQADSFALQRGEGSPLHVERGPGGWRTTLPARAASFTSPQEAIDLLSDLVFHLDRLQIEDVLSPQPAACPLSAGYRYTVIVWLPSEGRTRSVTVQLGRLPDSREAAAYFPADGKLLGIPGSILVTLRSLSEALGFDEG